MFSTEARLLMEKPMTPHSPEHAAQIVHSSASVSQGPCPISILLPSSSASLPAQALSADPRHLHHLRMLRLPHWPPAFLLLCSSVMVLDLSLFLFPNVFIYSFSCRVWCSVWLPESSKGKTLWTLNFTMTGLSGFFLFFPFYFNY